MGEERGQGEIEDEERRRVEALGEERGRGKIEDEERRREAVSYTHLTLPTRRTV